MKFSVVIPVRNEEDSVREVYMAVRSVFSRLDGAAEILFVDDGSEDGTAERLDELAREDSTVQLIHFPRHFGKAAAYEAGFAESRGKRIVTIDGDLQDDPAEIPKLIDRLEEGFDLVVGWKQGRFDNEPLKKVPSMVFNGLIRLAFGLDIHDSNCGMRVMRRGVAESLPLYGDLYRFIPELASVRGFRVTEVPVRHRRRTSGRSKYGVSRFWTGLVDLLTVRFLTTYYEKPLHFFATLAVLPMLIGAGLEVYVLLQKLSGDTFQTHVAAIVTGVMFILVAVQLLATGLVGEMVGMQRHAPRVRKIQSVRHGSPGTPPRGESRESGQVSSGANPSTTR